MTVFSKLLAVVSSKTPEEKWSEAYRRAIREEAKVGGKVFGPIPKGTRREFFCLDEHTWVWHEEWNDESGKQHIRTTRYDIRPQGIFKAQNNQPYKPVTYQEAVNLYGAAKRYQATIKAELAPILQNYR